MHLNQEAQSDQVNKVKVIETSQGNQNYQSMQVRVELKIKGILDQVGIVT